MVCGETGAADLSAAIEVATDDPLAASISIVRRAFAGERARPVVKAFFHHASNTISYVVHDPDSGSAAIIDPVMDYDGATARLSSTSAQAIVDYVISAGLTVKWLLETHVHADHVSAADWLRDRLGGSIAIGSNVHMVEAIFGPIFNGGALSDASIPHFDAFLDDGSTLEIGGVEAVALFLPGHTPADMAFVIGDAVFVGDTIFMPDYGSARVDFPGGNARALYRSIRRLLRLPRETRVFICHDYKAPGRDHFAWETTVGEQRDSNVHVGDAVNEEAFVRMRNDRDRTLTPPPLLLPSIQLNLRAGKRPDPEANGISYVKLPLDSFQP